MIFLIHLLSVIHSNIDVITLNKYNHVSIKGNIDSYTTSLFINDIEKIKKKSIYLYIDSTGGSVHYGEKIIQYIEYKKEKKTVFICIAHHAYSMAFHIYQHCNFRVVLPSSTIMQHQMSLSTNGSLENVQNHIDLIHKINNYLIKIESKRLKITNNEYKTRISSDWWLYGIDIIKYNTADIMIKGIGCHRELMVDNKEVVSNDKLIILSKCPLV